MGKIWVIPREEDSIKIFPILKEFSDGLIESSKGQLDSKVEIRMIDAKGTVTGIAAFGLLAFSGEDELRGKDVELRVVECPEYDGPNPDFDEEDYKKRSNEHTALVLEHLKSLGVTGDGPSPERTRAVIEFTKLNPSPKCNNWTYCDYNKVIEWAKNVPTKFIDVIKPVYGEPV